MKHAMEQGAVNALLFSSIFTRLFWGMAVDAPVVHTAAWLCPFIGFLLFLPLAMIAVKRLSPGNETPWQQLGKLCPEFILKTAALLISVCFLLDCASGVRILAGTANLISMDKTPLFYLLLPLGLFAAVSILLGNEAAGNCARLWIRFLAVLTAIVIISHLHSYNIAWLTPLLGSGAGSILKGGVYCAGAIALQSLQWLFARPSGSNRKPFAAILLAVLASSLQLAALQMLSPSMTDLQLSRSSRMQLILSNGRTALPLQILLMLLCYGGFLQLIAAEATACAGFLSYALPKAPCWSFATGIAAAVIALSSLPYRFIEGYSRIFILIFPIIGMLVLILLSISAFRRSKASCAKHF